MKKNIQPNYNLINVEMTDGTQFKTRSTWGNEGDVLKLEIDPKSHSAWTGGKQKILDKGRISKFNKKFQNFRSEDKK
jgi:large subunit ribosomal protein L31